MDFHTMNNYPLLTILNEKFCVCITDTQGRITYINDNYCRLTGYAAEELTGRSYTELVPLTNCSAFEELAALFAHEKIHQEKVRGLTKDKKPFWLNEVTVPMKNDHGEVIQYTIIGFDITDNEKTTKKYKKALSNLRNIENALDHSSVVAVTDAKGIIIYVNEKFCALSQYSEEELIGSTHNIINSGYHPKEFFDDLWKTIKGGNVWTGDIRNRAKDGSIYWVSTTIVPFLGKDGHPEQFIAIRHDITDRKLAEESLETAFQDDFRTTVKNLHNAIFKYFIDENGETQFTLFEGRISERSGLTMDLLNSGESAKQYSESELNTIRQHLRDAYQGEVQQFEIPYGELVLLVYLSPVVKDGKVTEVVGTAIDITERVHAERVIEQMAFFDYLTGLPNRRSLQNIMREKIAEAKSGKLAFSVLFLDLDRFKHVNDSMGHHIGDELLKAVGKRIQSVISRRGTAARLSGDEFIIIYESIDTAELTAAAEQLNEVINQPYMLYDQEVFVSPSIGIARYPADGEDYNALMRNADSAMYSAKEVGREPYRFFTMELHEELMERTFLEIEVRQALPKKQLSLHYQPQLDLQTGKLKGIEALLRWTHPVRGPVSPAQFIPIAEENGTILSIGEWVLRTACEQAKAWQDKGFRPFRMSVNVSMRQFIQPSFVEDVLHILSETGLEPAYLNLEITESLMTDVHRSHPVLQQLRDAGITVSIDDFGTGYSSFLYLSKLPISHLKIDQAFIRELSENNTMIVKAIIDLAKNLKLTVIAEGVETKEQEAFLKQLHCDEVQGYLYSRPVTAEEAEKLIRKH